MYLHAGTFLEFFFVKISNSIVEILEMIRQDFDEYYFGR